MRFPTYLVSRKDLFFKELLKRENTTNSGTLLKRNHVHTRFFGSCFTFLCHKCCNCNCEVWWHLPLRRGLCRNLFPCTAYLSEIRGTKRHLQINLDISLRKLKKKISVFFLIFSIVQAKNLRV